MITTNTSVHSEFPIKSSKTQHTKLPFPSLLPSYPIPLLHRTPHTHAQPRVVNRESRNVVTSPHMNPPDLGYLSQDKVSAPRCVCIASMHCGPKWATLRPRLYTCWVCCAMGGLCVRDGMGELWVVGVGLGGDGRLGVSWAGRVGWCWRWGEYVSEMMGWVERKDGYRCAASELWEAVNEVIPMSRLWVR